MQLHQIRPRKKLKKSKRIGRGGKRGSYSGRGVKGQKSRAGHRIKPELKKDIMKMPKLRGVKNKPKKPKSTPVNLENLERKFAEKEVVNKTNLFKKGIIKNKVLRIKILGKGEIKKPLSFEGVEVSKSAKEKIIKSGGFLLD